MKKLLFTPILAIALILSGCDLLNFNSEETNPEKTMGKVGNYWNFSATGYTPGNIVIESNDNGNVVASFPYKGQTKKVQGKVTDNGFYDYVYSNGDTKKPFTLVKFDAKVGDKYEFKVGNQTIVREVVHVSTTDDTFYGGLIIKTIDVKETIPAAVQINGVASGVSQILWRFNHKFGFISADVTETSNKVTKVYSTTTNATN